MFRKIALGLLTCLVLLAALIFWVFRPISETHPAQQSDLPDLVPLRHFYADAHSKWRYRLSPDGTHLAWLEAKRLKPALWVRPLEGEETEIYHTPDEVRWYAWSADSRYLLYQADRDGWENDVIVSIDVTKPGSEPRSYDFGKSVKSRLHAVPANGGAHVLIRHNGRDPARFDLYRLNLDTGEAEAMDLISELGVHWRINRDGDVYARTVYASADDWRAELRQEDGTWREIAKGGLEDDLSIIDEPGEDGRVLAISNLGRDTSALVRFDPANGTEEVLHQDDQVDISWVETDWKTGKLQSVITYPDFQARHYFDDAYEAMLTSVPTDGNTALHRVSSTHDGSKMIIETEHSTKGWSKYLVDAKTKDISPISTARIEAHAAQLSETEPVQITASDGLTLHATLTRPKGVSGPAPMVILIHGGPVVRSAWGFSAMHKWLANRGYVVLDVNYRGSGGFGRAFREAAVGEVSRKMHTDIVDARAWAVDQGLADPAKVAVLGGSFGGLKVLTALTEAPDLFAAGIDINGISDISTMLDEVPVYWQGWPNWYLKYIGDPKDPGDLAEIKRRSPLYNASNLTSPLLIIQGARDVRVIQDQADRMVEALQNAGKPVEYMLLPEAGHQFSNWGWKTRLIAYRRMERFLATHLGGRADGFDYAVLGAYILP